MKARRPKQKQQSSCLSVGRDSAWETCKQHRRFLGRCTIGAAIRIICAPIGLSTKKSILSAIFSAPVKMPVAALSQNPTFVRTKTDKGGQPAIVQREWQCGKVTNTKDERPCWLMT